MADRDPVAPAYVPAAQSHTVGSSPRASQLRTLLKYTTRCPAFKVIAVVQELADHLVPRDEGRGDEGREVERRAGRRG